MITEPVVLHPRRYAGMSAEAVVDSILCRRCSWPTATGCTCRPLSAPESGGTVATLPRTRNDTRQAVSGGLSVRKAAS